MKAVILAAGKGTRMKEITKEIPKPMVMIKGKPMLEHIITYLQYAGITDLGIVVGYKQSVVQNYFGDGSSRGITITYIEQTVQNGTGSALHLAKDYIDKEPFVFTFGDVITPRENYRGMLKYFHSSSCDVVMGLNRVDDPYRGAAVYIDDDYNIIRMVEKPPLGTSTTNLNNAGIMFLDNKIFGYTARLGLSPRGEYELTDIFGMLQADGHVLKGYILSGYWKDVGTALDLEAANGLLD
jgi:UDP-N-acetylglucosamine diphosphorylase / glucose-1-phosphate thymidylyltransferase / UDP-N-acetylgalactosamine diphosphorylase / glucosamine-1-phosphate N-acetyltransferase / galactosamine-1-phosphate N-acetyltransferase